jgi:predicted small metal-binding protein
MKLVRYRNHGFDCDFEAKGKTEEEVLNKAAEHVHVVHGMEVTPELADQVRTTIHEVPAQQRAES